MKRLIVVISTLAGAVVLLLGSACSVDQSTGGAVNKTSLGDATLEATLVTPENQSNYEGYFGEYTNGYLEFHCPDGEQLVPLDEYPGVSREVIESTREMIIHFGDTVPSLLSIHVDYDWVIFAFDSNTRNYKINLHYAGVGSDGDAQTHYGDYSVENNRGEVLMNVCTG